MFDSSPSNLIAVLALALAKRCATITPNQLGHCSRKGQLIVSWPRPRGIGPRVCVWSGPGLAQLERHAILKLLAPAAEAAAAL